MQFQKYIKGCLEVTLSPGIEDRKGKLVVDWTIWLYIYYCCDIYPACQ